MSEASGVRSAARGAVFFSAAHASLMLSGYVVAIVLGRGLGPELYGVYGLVYSVLHGTELIGRLGVPQALSQRIASATGSTLDLRRTGVALSATVNLLIFAAFWIWAPAMARLFQVPGGAELFRIASLDIPFYGLYIVGDHMLNGQRRFGMEAGGILLYATTRMVGILALFFWLGLSVEAALIVNVAASVVGLGYMFVASGPRSFVPRFTETRTLVRTAIPIGVFGIGMQLLNNMDLWILNAAGDTVPELVKGHYVAALSLARIPNVVSMVMMAVLVPTMARALATGDHAGTRSTVRGTSRFLAVALLPTGALVAVEASPILELMFSQTYAAGGSLLAILIFSHGVFYPLMVTFCAMLIAADRGRTAAAVTLGTVPLAVVVDVVLTNLLGAQGAALGAVLSFGGASVAAIFAVHRHVAPMSVPPGLLAIVLASLAVAAAGMALSVGPALLIPEIVVLAALYLAGLGVVGVVGREDVDLLRGRRRTRSGEEGSRSAGPRS